MSAASDASNPVQLQSLELAEPASIESILVSKPPTPAKGCSVHPEMLSRDGVAFGLLQIHDVPPAAPAQTGTECRYILPRPALEQLYAQLGDLLDSDSS